MRRTGSCDPAWQGAFALLALASTLVGAERDRARAFAAELGLEVEWVYATAIWPACAWPPVAIPPAEGAAAPGATQGRLRSRRLCWVPTKAPERVDSD